MFRSGQIPKMGILRAKTMRPPDFSQLWSRGLAVFSWRGGLFHHRSLEMRPFALETLVRSSHNA